MNIWSLVFGIIAAVCFAIEAFGFAAAAPERPRRWSFIALGLLFFVLCFMAQLLISTSSPITT
jgi:hypothetical protein